MLLLGVDLETTHYDIDILRVTEVGAVLYDTEVGAPIEVQADIVKEDDIKLPMDPYIVDLTGITDGMVEKYGKTSAAVINKLNSMLAVADYVIGHNGNNFDKPVLDVWAARYGLEITQKPWIDTMTDIPYPEKINTRKLEDLTGRHGFLNPFPHRAFTDVMAMMRVLSNYDLEEVIKISKSPMKKYAALVSYHDRQLAKDAGFRWDTTIKMGSKSGTWTKEIKECFVDTSAWDFEFQDITE